MGTLSEWLSDENRNYWVGVSLYASQKCNRNVLRLLQQRESVSNMKKLIYELGKFADAKPVVPVKVTTSPVSSPIVFTAAQAVAELVEAEQKRDVLYFHDLPADLRPVLAEKNKCFTDMCFLKVELNELPDELEDKAYSIQVKIDDLQKRRDLCWKKLDYWKEHRAVPEAQPSEFETMTPEMRVKRQQYFFQNISKLKKRIAGYYTALETETSVPAIAKIKKALAKSESNLIAQEESNLALSNLIDGR